MVNGFTGSSIWHLLYSFPPVSDAMIDAGFKDLADRWNPILDVFKECGVKFGLEVHPTEIAFDLYSAETALKALDYRPEFGFNFDPSHLLWQFVDPVEFIRAFPDRIYHMHVKDAARTLNGKSGHPRLAPELRRPAARLGLPLAGPRPGRLRRHRPRALNEIGYTGPLSVEWEDPGMDREYGAAEAARFVKEKMGFTARRPTLRPGVRRGPGEEVSPGSDRLARPRPARSLRGAWRGGVPDSRFLLAVSGPS